MRNTNIQRSVHAPRPRRHRALGAAVTGVLAALAANVASADLTHRYSFNGSTTDSIGGSDGTLNGAGTYDAGNTSLNFNGTDTFVALPGVVPFSSATFEIWGTYDSTGGGWERIFDFGSSQANNLFLTPKSGPGDTRFRMHSTNTPTNDEQGIVLAGNLTNNTPMLLTAVMDGNAKTMSLYRDGSLIGTSALTIGLANLVQSTNYIGKSQYPDPLLKGSLNEFRIYDTALTAKQIALNAVLGPDNLTTTGTNDFQTPGAGNWATGTWSLGHVPTNTELVTIANGAAVTVNSNVGSNPLTQVSNGSLNVATGGVLNASIDLAPGNANSAAVNVNGGDLTVFSVLVDGGDVSGNASKQFNFNGGTLHTVGNFNLAGVNLTSAVGASGVTFDTQSTSNVTWGVPLTPAAGASLTKVGAGSLSLAVGGFAGQVTVRAGTLNVAGNVGTAGASLLLGDGNFANGAAATLGITANATVLSPITVGTSTATGAYTLNLAANANVSVPGAVTLNRPLTVTTAATTGTNALSFTGGFTSGGAGAKTLNFNNAGIVNVGAVGITDGGGGTLNLAKNNGGVLVLSAPNTYTGATVINGGGILFAAPSTVAGTGRNVTVNAGGVAAAGPAFDYTNLTGTFLSRIVQPSAGVVALTANSAENLNFSVTGQNFTAASLGAGTNVTYTGTLTPNGTIYRLGGGGGVLTLPNANAVTGANALIVGGALNGTVVLGGPNNYTGGTTLRSGALSVADPASLGANGITFTGGTLQVTGATPFATPQPLIFTTGGGTFQIDNTAGATFSGLVVNSGATTANNAPITKTGAGNLILTGSVNVGNNSIWVRNGTLTADGSANVVSTFYNSIGQLGDDNGTLVVQGNAQYSVAHDFNVGDVNNAKGALYIKDNATVRATTFFAGKFDNTQGVVVQTGGLLTNNTGFGEWRIGGVDQNASTSVGSYDLSGGSLVTAANYQVGAFGNGAMTITGGATATVGGYPVAGRFPGGYGVLTVTNGTFNQVNANTGVFLIIGEQGTGILNVSGSGRVNADLGFMRIGLANTGNGIVNLGTGGVLAATTIDHAAGGGSINFHGGTLLANNDSQNFLQNIPNAFVYSEGAVIDTNGKNVTVSQVFSDPSQASGSGISTIAVANGGSGYVANPVVKITGGGGDGASAVPILTNGVVTGIKITNPGTGYTDPATVTILGGGGTGAVVGTVALAPNLGGGGLTKVGAGNLTLGGQSTYSGDTVINAGTAIQGNNGVIPSGAGKGNLVVNGGAVAGGAFDLNGIDANINGLAGSAGASPARIVNNADGASVTLTVGNNDASASFAGQILNTPGVIAVTKVGIGTQTLAGANTYTGPTFVNAGTLRVSGSIAGSGGVTVFDGGTFEAGSTQAVQKILLLGGVARVTGGATVATASVLTVGTNGGGSEALVIAPGTKVDLTTNGLVLDVAPGSEAAAASDVRAQIILGRAGGTWQGNGITSSSAAFSPGARAVGYALATEVLGPTGGDFMTTTGVDASSVLVRYTLNGDANLDGKVGFPDLVAVAQHYDNNTGSAAWSIGDFDYDGNVGFSDLVAVAQNYDGALPGSGIPGASADFNRDLAAAFASVPEPGVISLGLVAACGLVARRRRRR